MKVFSSRKMLSTIVTLASLTLLCSCDSKHDRGANVTPVSEPTGRVAQVVLNATEGNNVTGKVEFIELHKGIRVHGEVNGLTEGEHGFHIHEFGNCSSPDASSAGGHYNPQHSIHAGPDDLPREVGDLGNIKADKNGKGKYDRIDFTISFDEPNSIIGKSLIVHSDPDDFVSQPTGNAGSRVACGVIELVEEEK